MGRGIRVMESIPGGLGRWPWSLRHWDIVLGAWESHHGASQLGYGLWGMRGWRSKSSAPAPSFSWVLSLGGLKEALTTPSLQGQTPRMVFKLIIGPNPSLGILTHHLPITHGPFFLKSVGPHPIPWGYSCSPYWNLMFLNPSSSSFHSL